MKSTYAILTHGIKPRQPTMTILKDYMKQDVNTVTDESLLIVVGTLKIKHIQEAAIILDLTKEKIVKSRSPKRTYEELYTYIKNNYNKKIETLNIDKKL